MRQFSFRVHPLIRALRGAACGLLIAGATAGPVLAAESTHQQQHHYRVPAGPLGPALGEFASQAGITLSFEPALVAGRSSPGLDASTTIEEGLRRLLAGSGLESVRAADGGYTLRPQPAGAPVTLGVLRVGGVATTATEGTGAYAATTISTFKAAQSVRRTPQSVTVVSRQLLDDRFMPDLHDVLMNVPGVTVDYTDSERVTYHSRGYQIDAIQIDGLTVNPSGSIFVQPDTAVLDRIEILRGSAGMLRGSGNPSATVNLVRKRPTAEFQGSVGVTLGSWDRQRFEGDLSGSLTESIRGRVVAVADQKEFFQRAREEEHQVFYGVLEADVTARTLLTVSYQYTDLDATGAWGSLPADFDGSQLDLPRSAYLGADWNRWNRYTEQSFAELEHRFDNEWTVKVNVADTRFRMKDDGFKQTYFSRPAGATNPYIMDVSASIYGGDASDQLAFGAIANGPFELFGRRHELVVGGERLKVKTTGTTGVGFLNPMTVDIRNWNPDSSMAEPFVSIAGHGVVNYTRQEGVYTTARFSITDPLTAIVGARLSWWEYEVPSRPSGDYRIDRETTPYVGLVYDLTDTWSAYASYTEIFLPQNATDAGGNTLDPVRGEDYEAGVKGEYFEGRLNLALSLFRINNVGKAVEDASTPIPCLPYYTTGHCTMAGGKTRSEGWELEIAGEVLPGWQVTGGYTNTRTEYIRDSSAANVGQPLRTADPRHLLRLFTSYRFNGMLDGLMVGGGVQAQSDIYTRTGAVTARQGGYAIYNLMAGYRFDNGVGLQLNANNIFDKVYYKKVGTGVNNYYGDPRNVMLNVRYDF